jgi:hypothetical protein|tara:strand:+ start:224 stop:415 length:192 start_codon:yes stop_codon:yes gene_type:complete
MGDTKTLTNKDLQTEIKRDRSSTNYLEIQGVKRNNIKNLPRGIQQDVESFIGVKTLTVWIRKQ